MCEACRDQITARQTVELLSLWDSLYRQRSEDGLAWTYGMVNSLPEVPAPLEVPVYLDQQRVQYRALIFESHRLNVRPRPAQCLLVSSLALVLWREVATDTALDIISTSIDAEPGTMEGSFERGTRNSCNWPSPMGGAYLNRPRSPILGTGRQAISGKFRVIRLGSPSECVFIKDLASLEVYGTTCQARQYSVDLDATLSPDRTGRGAAGGAIQVRLSSSSLPGAIFTIDCTKTQWSRQHCG